MKKLSLTPNIICRKHVFLIFLLFLALIGEYQSGYGQSSPKRVIIDTDTYNEIDDQFALVYALASQSAMQVEAIYAAPFHNARSTGPKDGMLKSHEEILRLLDLIGMESEGLVFKGSESFMTDTSVPVPSEAAEDLIKRALESSDTLYVLTLGAPTNVASAIVMEPKIKDKIKVIWLGGKGLTWHTAYEFNLKQDIPASQVLFDSGVPLVQVPTEPVSSHLTTTLPELKAHLQGKSKIADYLLHIFEGYHSDHYAYAKVIWDIAVIAYMVNPQWLPTESRSTPILTDELTYRFDESRNPYTMVYFVDRNPVFKDLFQKLAKF